MDHDRTEGKMKDVKGRIKRQVGEWTDNEKLQGEGAMDQAEGKIQNTFGKAKDAVRDIGRDAEDATDDRDFDRKKTA